MASEQGENRGQDGGVGWGPDVGSAPHDPLAGWFAEPVADEQPQYEQPSPYEQPQYDQTTQYEPTQYEPTQYDQPDAAAPPEAEQADYLRARYGEEFAAPEAQAWAQPVTPQPRRKRTPWLVAALVAVLVAAGGGAWVALTGGGGGGGGGSAKPAPPPEPTAAEIGTAYLQAWAKGDYQSMDDLVLDDADDVAGVYQRLAERLKIQKVAVTPGAYDATTGTMPFSVAMTLKDVGAFGYDGTLSLVKAATTGADAAAGSPSPSGSGKARTGWRVKFTSATVHPDLTNGQRLTLASAGAATDPARTAVLDRFGKPLADDDDLAANVLGTSPKGGSGGSGLLRALADQLGGSTGVSVAITDVTTGRVVETLKEFPGKPGAKVKTTIDLTYQRAAERALAKARPGPHAAVVAIDTRTGGVLALANKQISGVPTAQNGVYPPGSTFKVITAIAGLEHGLTPSSRVECPNELSVVGKVFSNHEKARSTSLSLTDAFAQSCNTAFINVAKDLPDGALQETAQRFGFASEPGRDDLLPIAAAVGDIPDTPNAVDLAASAIGQGKVQSTPLHMASVAAGIASGTWRQPRLLADCDGCASHAVPESGAMRTLMRAVVTSGTGTGMRGVRGGPVYAKTGTPEWGSDDPPATHGWLIGWQGHTAFAVFVENGSTGAAAAVPVAAAFLKALPAGH